MYFCNCKIYIDGLWLVMIYEMLSVKIINIKYNKFIYL